MDTASDTDSDSPRAAHFLTQQDCCLFRERLEATVDVPPALCELLRQLQAARSALCASTAGGCGANHCVIYVIDCACSNSVSP